MNIKERFSFRKEGGKDILPVIRQVEGEVRALEFYEDFAVRSLLSGEERARRLNSRGPHTRIFSTPFNNALLVIEPRGARYSPFSPDGFEKLKDLSSGLQFPTIIQNPDSHHVLGLEFHRRNELNASRVLGYYSPKGSSRPHALLYFSSGMPTFFSSEIMHFD